MMDQQRASLTMGARHKQNSLLRSILPADRTSFAADLTSIDIQAHDHVCTAGKRLTHAYFPTGAVISALCASNGKAMEVHGIGREGMLGPGVLFAEGNVQFDLMCQIGGSMLYMPSSRFAEHLQANTGLQRAIAIYSLGVVGFLAQSIACTGLHTIAQRCARWLLITSDRVAALEFSLTHELLARMLGVRRSGISVAVHRLQRLGIIRYRFGRMAVLDRKRLELESCECYRIVARDFKRILALT